MQIGSLRVRAKLEDLEHRAAGLVVTPARASRQIHRSDLRRSQGVFRPRPRHLRPGMEVNLRGKLVEDGLDELDRYLEKAYGCRTAIRPHHPRQGHGQAARGCAGRPSRDNPYVSSFEEAHDNEGGAGVTIARLARG